MCLLMFQFLKMISTIGFMFNITFGDAIAMRIDCGMIGDIIKISFGDSQMI